MITPKEVPNLVLRDKLNPTEWVSPTLTDNWEEYAVGGGNATSGYRKLGDQVILKGVVTKGDAAASDIFTLPANHRPGAVLWYVVPAYYDGSTASSAVVIVYSTGVVQFYSLISGAWNTASGYLALDGISFYTDQGQ